jgi:TolB protein
MKRIAGIVVWGIWVTILSSAVPVTGQQQSGGVRLGTSRIESHSLEIAIPEFSVTGTDTMGLGAEAAKAMIFDLTMSGNFKSRAHAQYLKAASERDRRLMRIDYEEWQTLASNFLVKGSIEIGEGGDIEVSVTVYDLQTKRRFYSRTYKGAYKRFRTLVHHASDDILEQTTGIIGVARTEIAFVSKIRGRKELMTMDYDGHNVQSITTDQSLVLFPSWHPSGKMILFTTYRYRNPDLYALSLVDGTRYPVSRRIGLNSTGEWSPDGREVVFSLSRQGNSDIFITSADGKNLRQLTRSYALDTSPTISPDGQWIAYTSDRSGSPQIYVMRINGEGQRRLTFEGKYNDGASWAPKGGSIAYTSLFDQKFEIALIEANSMTQDRPREITRIAADGSYNYESPTFSPNGDIIAFCG